MGGFLWTGEIITKNIADLLDRIGRPLHTFERLLDFGSGSGRVLRNLSFLPGELHGADIDPELVEWCTANIPWATFAVNPHLPPSPYPDAFFDLIYSISVFTHLDEEYQDRWLTELERIAAPGAILILTIHGEFAQRGLSVDRQNILRKKGLLYITGATGNLKLDGLPDFYQTTFHTADYIRERWGRQFEVVDIVPQAVVNHQDAVILRRKS